MKTKATIIALALFGALPAAAQEAGQWYLQAGPAAIRFHEGTALSLGGAGVPGAEANVSDENPLALGLGYFITPQISVIGIIGLPPTSTITGGGAITGLTPGKIKYGPSVFAANYHFNTGGRFQPFVGAGFTYTVVLDEKSRDLTDLKAENAFGGVLRLGFDYMIDDHQGVFFSAQKLFIDTTVTGTVASHVPGLAGAPAKAEIDLDPVILHAGYTYRF